MYVPHYVSGLPRRPRDYPAEGECSKALDRSWTYIQKTRGGRHQWFKSGTRCPKYNQRYPQQTPSQREWSVPPPLLDWLCRFFNVDDDATWCNDASFGLGIFGRPNLNLELRRAINDLVERLNRVIQSVAEGFNDPRVGYIDTTAGFDGGRFCEPNHSLKDQYFGTNVKLWNLSPEGSSSTTMGCIASPEIQHRRNSTTGMRRGCSRMTRSKLSMLPSLQKLLHCVLRRLCM